MTEDRSKPPEGYSVWEMCPKANLANREWWLARARLESGGEKWTEAEAIAACWAHHGAIAKRAREAAARALEEAADSVCPVNVATWPWQHDTAAWLRERAAKVRRGDE